MLTSFHFALSFLTTLPFPFKKSLSAREIAASLSWFPLVGFLLGLIISLVFYLFTPLLPRQINSVIILIIMVLLTGGFHLDGLADTADGFLSARSHPEDILNIMKDSSIGTMGALGLILVLLLKYTTISQLPDQMVIPCLILLPAYGRFTIVILAYLASYARKEGGLGEAITQQVSSHEIVYASAFTIMGTLLLTGFKGFLVLIILTFYTWGIKIYATRRIGGITGDLLGFCCESSEALALVCWIALFH
jgi:adenosylcobinamide-GDP ribazoletransferase